MFNQTRLHVIKYHSEVQKAVYTLIWNSFQIMKICKDRQSKGRQETPLNLSTGQWLASNLLASCLLSSHGGGLFSLKACSIHGPPLTSKQSSVFLSPGIFSCGGHCSLCQVIHGVLGARFSRTEFCLHCASKFYRAVVPFHPLSLTKLVCLEKKAILFKVCVYHRYSFVRLFICLQVCACLQVCVHVCVCGWVGGCQHARHLYGGQRTVCRSPVSASTLGRGLRN